MKSLINYQVPNIKILVNIIILYVVVQRRDIFYLLLLFGFDQIKPECV